MHRRESQRVRNLARQHFVEADKTRERWRRPAASADVQASMPQCVAVQVEDGAGISVPGRVRQLLRGVDLRKLATIAVQHQHVTVAATLDGRVRWNAIRTWITFIRGLGIEIHANHRLCARAVVNGIPIGAPIQSPLPKSAFNPVLLPMLLVQAPESA